MPRICKHCGVNLEVEAEVFSRDPSYCHNCQGTEEQEKHTIYRALKLLRQNGIVCFTPDDLTTGELDNLIKGEG